MVLQAKAAKMTSSLKNLAMHIAGHLEENKLLKKQLDKCDKRLHLGIHDMTPRPDYREIFKRREFQHFKEDFLMKILRQELTSAEVIEHTIDVVKAYESRLHFAGTQANLSSPAPQTQTRLAAPKGLKKKTLASLKQLALEGPAEGRGSLWAKPKTGQAPEGGSSRHTESGSPRSSRLLSTAGVNGTGLPLAARRQQGTRPRRPSGSRSSSSSLDSVASRLSDQNYAAVRAIEQGMDDINKDLQRLVNI